MGQYNNEGFPERNWKNAYVAQRGEINYDKALFTHIKHGTIKEYYPEVKDGWHFPTGGNYKLGVIASYSFNPAWAIFLKAGKVYGQDFENNPTLPFYGNISIQREF